jgi:hypothetical protein
VKIFEFLKMHALLLTPHAQQNFRTTSKSENRVQNGDAMKKIKNACGVIDTACTVHVVSLTPHARSTNDSNGPGSL